MTTLETVLATAPTTRSTGSSRTAPGMTSIMTPGIVEGLELRFGEGPSIGGRASQALVVHPGAALDADGELIPVDRPIDADPSPALTLPGGRTLDLLLIRNHDEHHRASGEPAAGPQLHLQVSGEVPPPRSTRIAVIRRTAPTELEVAPIHAGLGGRRLVIGSLGSTFLIVDEGETVASGTVTIVGRRGSDSDDNGCLVVGRTDDVNLRMGRSGIAARAGGRVAELALQSDGGDTRFGGPIEGPDREPLTVVGGSDLSLGGGGVLMLGRASGPNLVLDENEIMARDDGRQAPITLQGDGGESRFGGPLRGPAGNPLQVVGGSDLSLGGQGVLMLGESESHHLVLDENEIMAGNGGRAADLHVQWRGGGTSFGGPISGGADGVLDVQPTGGTTRFGGSLEFHSGGRPTAWLDGTGTGRVVSRSDRTSMTDPEEVTDALQTVQRLRPVTYRPAGRTDQTAIGLLAEEVQEVAPHLVAAATDGSLGVRALDLAVLAIAAIAEQQQRIVELERIVASLTADRITTLGKRDHNQHLSAR